MSLFRSSALDQDPIDQIASEWVVLKTDRALTPDEERELSAWLAADPRHQQTYQALQRTWSEIPELSQLGNLVQIGPAAPTGLLFRSRNSRISLATLASAVAAMLVLLFVPGLWGVATDRYQTEIAEMRQVTLPDGSLVTLGARSELSVRFAANERRVALTGGEAFFDVVRDETRPFLVEAGPSLVRVMGTKFDVSHGAGTVRVAVLEGVVKVSDTRFAPAGASREKVLRARQRTEILLSASSPTASSGPMPAPAAGAWREGRLVYENARLADLVADVNRYYAPGVRILDPDARDQRITASFKTSEIAAFMSAVSGVVPVRAEESRGGSFTLSSTAN